MNPFAIAPHEFPGADFDPAPGAIVRHEIGGQKRTLWLKMQRGVIYFREPKRAPMFAVTRIFGEHLSGDALVEAWKREVEARNYGAYFITHRGWKGTLAAGNFRVITRENAGGWIAEHFDEKWREFVVGEKAKSNLWHPKPTFGPQSEQIFKRVGAQFLERSVEARHFTTRPAHWTGGSGEAMARVMKNAATLFFKPEDFESYAGKSLEWSCRSNSAFAAGAVTSRLTWSDCHRFNVVWNIAKWHFGYVGVEWKRASEHPELQAQYKPKVWQSGIEKWGENWRGNWVGTPFKTQITSPPLTAPSAHQKLEAALVLREFLRDKMPAEKLDKLLDCALKL